MSKGEFVGRQQAFMDTIRKARGDMDGGTLAAKLWGASIEAAQRRTEGKEEPKVEPKAEPTPSKKLGGLIVKD